MHSASSPEDVSALRKSSIISPTAAKLFPWIGRRTSWLSNGSDKSLINDETSVSLFLAGNYFIFAVRYAPSSRKKFPLYAACPDVSIARSLMPCSLSSMGLAYYIPISSLKIVGA